MMSNKLSFTTNNVIGIRSLKKWLKLIQYFKSKIGPCELLFLQETHSNSIVEQKWKKDFHGKTNSCGVVIVYCGTEKVTFKKQQTDHNSLILILDVSINYSEYNLIKLHNANIEKEQIEVLSNLFTLLKIWHLILTQTTTLLWLGILIYFLTRCSSWKPYFKKKVFG